MVLPFDSHNHIHLGPSSPHLSLRPPVDVAENSLPELCGMAIMSTHTRDFDTVLKLSKELSCSGIAHPKNSVHVVPCLGVHPWFLHQLSESEWELEGAVPKWIARMEYMLRSSPQAIVGEIGLDGFHFDPQTKDLVSPMEKQIVAFQLQLELAAKLNRPVSIHAVRCFGPLMEVLSKAKKTNEHSLPPRIYFHAFGGKAGTIDQLLALCGRETGRVYFGFAPVINFRSKKTVELVRKVGIDHLVLETDHEDAARVLPSISEGVRFLSEALEIDEAVVIERTTLNAYHLYGLDSFHLE